MTKVITASTVRSFYQGNEKSLARLSDAAKATVAKGARGRLHPEVVTDYNKRRKADHRYVSGVSLKATADRKAQRDALKASGVEVGKRGPLSKDALAALKG